MNRVFLRLVGLPRGELSRALPLFTYLFLTIAGSVASKAARDALFLDRFAATALPYVDIAVAVLVGLVAGVYIRLGSRTNLRNVQMASLLAFAAMAAAFWWASRLWPESGTLFVAIYVWVGILSVLVPVQVWTLARLVMTTREARRAFGFVGAGAILGWIAGGSITRLIAGRLGTEGTLLWVTTTLVASAALVWLVWQRRPAHLVPPEEDTAPAPPPAGLGASLSLVRGSRHLTTVAALVCLSGFVTTIAGWQFKAIAKENIPDTDALAMFFGTFNMVAGLVALLVQLLATGRILRIAGVGAALFIVPIAMTASSVALLVFGSLAAVSAVKASDQVLRYSVDKATIELLYLPVPAAITFRVKSFIDTVVYRAGDALGGAAILVLATMLGATPVQVTWMSAVALAGWFWAAFVARREYVDTLRESIHQHRLDVERAAAPVLDRTASALIAARLGGEPHEVAYALRLLDGARDLHVPQAVRHLLRHESPEVRAQAVRLLAREGDPELLGDIEQMLNDPHFEVRTEALLFLAQHAPIDPLQRIEQLGDFPDFSLRAAMAAFLARPGRAQNLEAARLIVKAMAEEPGEQGRRTRLEAAQLIATAPDMFDPELRRLLADPDPDVAAAAMRAAGRLRKSNLAPRVIARMADPVLQGAASDVLAQLGEDAIGAIARALADPCTPAVVRRALPGVLDAIGTPEAREALLPHVLDADAAVRHRVIAALNRIEQKRPARRARVRLIEAALGAEIAAHYRSYQELALRGGRRTGADAAADPALQRLGSAMAEGAERIFRLLKILYPSHDLHSAFVGLHATDPVVHDNATEFLDAVLPPPLRRLIVPLFDRGVSDRRRARLADRIIGAPGAEDDEADAVAVLARSRDPWLQACAAHAIGELRLERFRAILAEWASHPDPLVRAAAVEARRRVAAR